LPAQFIRVFTSNLADLYAFFGFVNAESPWFMKDFDENAFATHSHVEVDAYVKTKNLKSIEVYQPGV
jgi:hypothetical protein